MMVKLQPQECEGNYKFNSQIVYTRGMESTFGEDIFLLIFQSMVEIKSLVEQGIADYFQVFTVEYKNNLIKFYCIDSIDYITFLLVNEY